VAWRAVTRIFVSRLRSCGPLAYSDNERAKQLLYALVDHVWGIKITALEEPADFATLDTEKLFSKLKSHELSRKVVRIKMLLFLVILLLIVLMLVAMMLTPPTPLSQLLWSLLCPLWPHLLMKYEITLLARKFCALHVFCKERRRSPRGCFKCGNTTHFIADCPKRKKLDSSSNKYDYTKRNDYSKGDDNNHRFGDKKKKKF
jgi:hypothetical protein